MFERRARSEALRHAPEHKGHDEQADGDVEPEDPLPGEALGNGAAHHRTSEDGQPGHTTEGPECPRPLLRREGHAQLRHGQRHHQRRAAPLDGARGDQGADVGSERAGRRCRHEQPQANNEQAPAPEAVAERRAGHQQHREAEGVGIHRPLQCLDGGAQVQADCTQGGRDDQGVEPDHERRD